jgi:hypothetical protein
MHCYAVEAPFGRIATDIAGPYPESERGKRHLLIATDQFTKWPEVYAIPNQEAPTVADTQVINFSHFAARREVYSNHERNFDSRLMQEVLQRLRISNTRTTPLPAVPWHGGTICENFST